jgi:hypothetical protein
MLSTRKLMLAAATAAGVFGTAAVSNAALILNINNGAVVVTDNGAGDSDPTVGRIANTTTSAAGYSLAITLGTSNSPGSTTAGLLQINSLNVENGANPAVLDIRLSDTGFTNPGGAGTPMTLQGSVGGTYTGGSLGNSVAFQSFADPANGQPAAAVSTPNLTFTKATPLLSEPFSGSNAVAWARAAGPYSLAEHLVITLSANGQVQIAGATNATAVPEPASIGLLGLSAVAALARRRRA